MSVLQTAVPVLAASTTEPGSEFNGLTGWVVDVLGSLGEIGVALLTLVETLIPPIPSEIVLPLSGYLAQRGRMDLALVLLAATIGSVLGAALLYALGATIGVERATTWLTKVPFVEREDIDPSVEWFYRHGPWAVFFGRLVPGVRSLISLPAGATDMSLRFFLLLTTAGSLLWNSILVVGGYLLGTQYLLVEEYAGLLDYFFIAAVVLLLGYLITRKVQRKRQAATPS